MSDHAPRNYFCESCVDRYCLVVNSEDVAWWLLVHWSLYSAHWSGEVCTMSHNATILWACWQAVADNQQPTHVTLREVAGSRYHSYHELESAQRIHSMVNQLIGIIYSCLEVFTQVSPLRISSLNQSDLRLATAILDLLLQGYRSLHTLTTNKPYETINIVPMSKPPIFFVFVLHNSTHEIRGNTHIEGPISFVGHDVRVRHFSHRESLCAVSCSSPPTDSTTVDNTLSGFRESLRSAEWPRKGQCLQLWVTMSAEWPRKGQCLQLWVTMLRGMTT